MTGALRTHLATYAGEIARALFEIHPDATSIVWKGSAYKPWDGPYDFIPGLSDLDVHVYRPGGLVDPFALRRRLFATVGDPPSGTPLQLLILDSDNLPNPWTLLEGTYGVLVGDPPPVPPADEDDMRRRDLLDLRGLDGWIRQIASGVVDRSEAELWEFLRRVRWMFPSILTRVATVAGENPAGMWRMNRTATLAHTAGVSGVGDVRSATVDYLEAAVVAAGSQHGSDAEPALRAGYHLLQTALEWVESVE